MNINVELCRRVLAICCLIATCFHFTTSRTEGETEGLLSPSMADEAVLYERPALTGAVLDQAGLRGTVTNWGFLGNPYRTIPDPLRDEPAPGLEYPAGSRVDYLYHAAVWVGGIVGTDTLVSTGARTFWSRQEFYPDTGAAGDLIFTDEIGDLGYQANYSDTINAPSVVNPDIHDGVHQPLDITLRQTTRGWVDGDYHDFLLVSLVVTNVGSELIQDSYIGWYVDPDVWHYDTPRGYSDDMVGFREGLASFAGSTYSYGAPYAIDNDGDPDSNGVYTDTAALGGLGLTLAAAHPPATEYSFNWWFTNRVLDLSWGPHRPGVMDIPREPIGDTARYRMMANGTIDYDLVYTGVDLTADGWAPPPDTFYFAAGAEMKFVYACGPFTVAPDDSVTLDFVFFLGGDVHSDPWHYQQTFDFDDPSEYLAGLTFTDWEANLAAALSLRESGFIDAAPGPPQNFAFESWTTNEVNLAWRPKETHDLAGYELFRREFGDDFGVIPLTTLNVDDSASSDIVPDLGKYEYAIRSFDTGGRRGELSLPLAVDLRKPLPVQIQRVASENGGLEISWIPSVYPDVDIYHLTRRFISAEDETTTVDLGSTGGLSFIDNGAEVAAVYEYIVTAESTYGLQSDPSAPVRGMRLDFDQGVLVLDETMADPSGFSNKDSVAAFWQRVLPSATYLLADRGNPPTLSIMDFNPHPVTIVISNGNFPETEDVRELLADYFLAGGRVLMVGRDLFNTEHVALGFVGFGSGDFGYDYFGITRAYYPPTLLSHPTRMNAECAGAIACTDGLPHLDVDSSRSNWGVPDELPPVADAIPFVGWIEGDTAHTQCLYTFQSRFGDTAMSDGQTTGLLFDDGQRRSAVLTFPLSGISEPGAAAALAKILELLSAPYDFTLGDLDGNGSVDPLDAVLLINYVFKGGAAPPVMEAADVNGDCRVNLIDVVVMVNYIFRDGPPPVPGCVQ